MEIPNNNTEKPQPTIGIEPFENLKAESAELLRGARLYDLAMLGGEDTICCCDEMATARAAGELCGVATIAPIGEDLPETAITAVYVKPEKRNQGYGSMLLKRAIERCLERGIAPVQLDLDGSNVAALKTINHLPDYLRDRLDIHLTNSDLPVDQLPNDVQY